jgi:AraC-like DNA-binding protein
MALTRIQDGDKVIDAAFDHGFESLSGFNEAFRRLAGVTSVRVYAIPEPARENDIGVEVSGRGVTEETIRSWCAAHLAHYKQPSEIRIG